MDKKTIAGDIQKLHTEFTKFHSQMLPKLGNDVMTTLRNEYEVVSAAIKKNISSKRGEPEKPTYRRFQADPALLKASREETEEGEEALKQLKQAKRKVDQYNHMLRAKY